MGGVRLRYDFIEIGCCDFDTIAQAEPESIGIAVEPVRAFLDRLPSRPGLTKVHAAIGERNGRAEVNHLCLRLFDKYPETPIWLKGCNSIGKPHPTVVQYLRSQGLPQKWVKKVIVPVLTVDRLFRMHDVTEVGIFKIDAEGMDCSIVRSLVQCCDIRGGWPDTIQFEANALSDPEEVDRTIVLLESRLYSIGERGNDIVAKLQHVDKGV